MASTPEKWKLVSMLKRDEQYSRLPKEWLLKSTPSSSHARAYLDVPRKCGLLDQNELDITENYDATALAQAIASQRLKSVDVVKAFCKRAAIAHQLTNCLTEIFFSDAISRAERLDAHLAAGNPPIGPLHGVPVSLKDTFKVNGYDASIGIAALAFKPSQTSATIVNILRDAGAVLYCKTNVPQTLMALDSHNNVFGRVLNPHNTSVTAGGSTGGEGALLAMRGSILGVGTDVGGSIRIPAMCNGIYGLKPSWQRVPYTGQENGTLPASSKLAISASAGPLAHSIRDLELFFGAVSDQKPWEVDPDVTPSPWTSLQVLPQKKVTLGLVRRDGLIEPHPPIERILDEVASSLRSSGIEVVEMDISTLFSQCQSISNGLFGVDGNNAIFDILESTGEPLSPWLATRLRRKAPLTVDKTRILHARRNELETAFLKIWKGIDGFICPVAPHAVPPIDRWNSVSYTSSFNLLDYPAGVVPVRMFEKDDMQGEFSEKPILNAWDKANRELWTSIDRSVYLDTPLSVQVVCPKLQERKLCQIMGVVDDALKKNSKDYGGPASAKL